MGKTNTGAKLVLPFAKFAAALLLLATAISAQAQAQLAAPPVQSAATSATRAVRTGPPASAARSPRDAEKMTNSNFSTADPKLPTLVIVGDSTAAGGDPAHRGWGAVLIDYFDPAKLNVVNRSAGGQSYRTFVERKIWDSILEGVKPGDYVLLQMGINDNGGIVPDAKRRADLPGVGEETKGQARADGTTETVHTYGFYVRKFVRDVRNKGANPIVLSAIDENKWESDVKVVRGHGDILGWAKQVATEEKAPFLDHAEAIGIKLDKLGKSGVASLFNPDLTHTTTEGAIFNAEAFIAALKGLGIKPLVDGLNDKGKAIEAYKPGSNL